MGEEFRKKSEVCPKLLNLMASKERNWIDEEDPSVLSLGYFPKASKPTKRGFLDTVAANTEGCPSSLHVVASVNAARPNSKSSQSRRSRGREGERRRATATSSSYRALFFQSE
ncbi:uncharacterized protein LOC109840979 [Asparagus officinalis]|uniref:uncharacterized protein LOC109840979 n=1 Tax=Asparagus officinalis TaxID=4686 RepID=UPI00098DF429|nr:uncharacterized protein LOC109840979 [Asparagus officinalis]